MADLTAQQVDHLLLLVGSNALPNALTGRLLAKPKAQITLIYSKGVSDVADSLKKWLDAQGEGYTVM